MTEETRLPPGLIINADDLGIHPGINAGIFSAYRHGILTSATMLMTTPYLDETLRQLRSETLPIGVHLSLTLGKPAAVPSDVPDLIDKQGNFRWSARQLLLGNFAKQNRKLLGQIQHEFEGQLGIALDHGLRPTHVDSHQHIHMNPAIHALLPTLLSRYGIKRLRWTRESTAESSLPLVLRHGKVINLPKVALLRYVSRKLRPELITTDKFFGVLFSGVVTKDVLRHVLLKISTQDSYELCIHPGLSIDATENPYPLASVNRFICSEERQVEHDILTDSEIKEVLLRRSLTLRDFSGAEKRIAYT